MKTIGQSYFRSCMEGDTPTYRNVLRSSTATRYLWLQHATEDSSEFIDSFKDLEIRQESGREQIVSIFQLVRR